MKQKRFAALRHRWGFLNGPMVALTLPRLARSSLNEWRNPARRTEQQSSDGRVATGLAMKSSRSSRTDFSNDLGQ
jgi:hypothetical protein